MHENPLVELRCTLFCLVDTVAPWRPFLNYHNIRLELKLKLRNVCYYKQNIPFSN